MDSKQIEFEKAVNVFIGSIERYFNKLTDTPIKTYPPFIKDPDDLVLKECTGMIGISGSKMGLVYISGGINLYKDLILQYVGLEDPTTSDMLDMAGELSNVVAGNVRESYGRDFMISIPIVFQGRPDQLKFPSEVPIYVIPFEWDGHEAYMVIGLK